MIMMQLNPEIDTQLHDNAIHSVKGHCKWNIHSVAHLGYFFGHAGNLLNG